MRALSAGDWVGQCRCGEYANKILANLAITNIAIARLTEPGRCIAE